MKCQLCVMGLGVHEDTCEEMGWMNAATLASDLVMKRMYGNILSDFQ